MTRTIKQLAVRVYTHNIRYATGSPFEGEVPWAQRRHLIVASIRFHAQYHAFVGLQEVLHAQLQYIMAELGDEWAYIGIGRNDGAEAGEYAPILYRPADFALQRVKTIWLSEDPTHPSKGWDASNPRILTCGRFEHVASGLCMDVYNTHLDDGGVRSRREACRLILQTMGESSLPAVLTGDFNLTPDEEPHQILKSKLVDMGLALPQKKRYGHEATYTGFSPPFKANRIDYIWGHEVSVRGYGVAHSQFEEVFMSDHRPVVADILV